MGCCGAETAEDGREAAEQIAEGAGQAAGRAEELGESAPSAVGLLARFLLYWAAITVSGVIQFHNKEFQHNQQGGEIKIQINK